MLHCLIDLLNALAQGLTIVSTLLHSLMLLHCYNALAQGPAASSPAVAPRSSGVQGLFLIAQEVKLYSFCLLLFVLAITS